MIRMARQPPDDQPLEIDFIRVVVCVSDPLTGAVAQEVIRLPRSTPFLVETDHRAERDWQSAVLSAASRAKIGCFQDMAVRQALARAWKS